MEESEPHVPIETSDIARQSELHKIHSIAKKEGISYEQCYQEYGVDVMRVLSRIYNSQHDRNYFRRTIKVFVPMRIL